MWPASHNHTLFETKMCDFLYPINDLTKNLIPFSRPDPNKSIPLIQTCLVISSQVQTNFKGIVKC